MMIPAIYVAGSDVEVQITYKNQLPLPDFLASTRDFYMQSYVETLRKFAPKRTSKIFLTIVVNGREYRYSPNAVTEPRFVKNVLEDIVKAQ